MTGDLPLLGIEARQIQSREGGIISHPPVQKRAPDLVKHPHRLPPLTGPGCDPPLGPPQAHQIQRISQLLTEPLDAGEKLPGFCEPAKHRQIPDEVVLAT